MLITVIAKPGRKRTAIVWQNDELTIALKAPATEGRANQELIKTLAEFFGLRRRQVTITRGQTARRKTVSIDLDERHARERLKHIEPPTQPSLL